jgi:hypothetical protein
MGDVLLIKDEYRTVKPFEIITRRGLGRKEKSRGN